MYVYPQDTKLSGNGKFEVVELTEINGVRSPGIDYYQEHEDGTITGYQRHRHDEVSKRIINDFIPAEFDPPLLSRRADGSLWVIDGGGRISACFELGITHVYCRILEGLSLVEEAQIFDNKGSYTQKIPKTISLMANFVDPDSWPSKVKKVLAEFNIHVGQRKDTPSFYTYLNCGSVLTRLNKVATDQKNVPIDEVIRKGCELLEEAFGNQEWRNSTVLLDAACSSAMDNWNASASDLAKPFIKRKLTVDQLYSYAGAKRGRTGATAGNMRSIFWQVINNRPLDNPGFSGVFHGK